MPTVLFSLDELKKLYDDAQKYKIPDLTPCQQYVIKYFYPMTNGTHFLWTKKRDTKTGQEVWDFEFMDQQTAKAVWFNRMPEEISKWYFKTNTKLYISDNDIYRERIDGDYINHSAGLKWKTRKPFKDFDPAIRKAVSVMLDYLCDVLSDGKKDQANYQINWYSSVVKGKKVSTCLYYKGPEGLGKSTFIDFFTAHVIGQAVSVKPSMEVLTTAFNMPLCGKLFVEFAEMPTFSTKQWVGVSGKMKDHITSNSLYFRNVFEKGFEARNLNNYVITTNVNAIKELGRRYCPLDCSTRFIKNYSFFESIRKQCFNDDVGYAFYNYLMELDTDNWHEERDMPVTENKLSAIADKLDPLYRFLKDQYILTKKNIKCTVAQLFDEYLEYCLTHGHKTLTKHPFTDKLREIQIEYRKSDGRNLYKVDINQLRIIADKHKWIHELDEAPVVDDDECDIQNWLKDWKTKLPDPAKKHNKKKSPPNYNEMILYHITFPEMFNKKTIKVKTIPVEDTTPKKTIILDVDNNEFSFDTITQQMGY